MRKIEIDIEELKRLLDEDKAPKRMHRIAAHFGIDRTTVYEIIKRESLPVCRQPVDLTGQRYTHLLVISCDLRKGRYKMATCLCDCGKTVNMRIDSLIRNQNISCGCRNGLVLAGRKFGRLTVIDRTSRQGLWECKCTCGATVTKQTDQLLSTDANNFMCLKCRHNYGKNEKNWKGFGEISSSYWSRTKKGAETRNLEFNITIEYAWQLFLDQNRQCALSGEPIGFTRNNKGPENTASIDRIDSLLGYIETNVQWLHKEVNTLKLDWAEERFIYWCTKIANHNDN